MTTQVLIDYSQILTELQALTKEHGYSQEKWEELDKLNDLNDYAAWVTLYLGTAVNLATQDEARYAALIKAANLCLTAAMRLRTVTLPARSCDDPATIPHTNQGGHNTGRAFGHSFPTSGRAS